MAIIAQPIHQGGAVIGCHTRDCPNLAVFDLLDDETAPLPFFMPDFHKHPFYCEACVDRMNTHYLDYTALQIGLATAQGYLATLTRPHAYILDPFADGRILICRECGAIWVGMQRETHRETCVIPPARKATPQALHDLLADTPHHEADLIIARHIGEVIAECAVEQAHKVTDPPSA